MRAILVLSAAIATCAATGCRDAAGPVKAEAGATTTPMYGLAFSYTLQTVGGKPLPYWLAAEDSTGERVEWGDLGFYGDSTFVLSLSIMTPGGLHAENDTGRYTYADAERRLRLTFRDGTVVEPILTDYSLFFQIEANPPSSGAIGAVRAAGSRWYKVFYTWDDDADDRMSSCPIVYAWDGNAWHLESGTFAGAVAPGWARTDVSALPHATALAGRLRLRMTDELDETEYVDGVQVVAVDHAPGTRVVPDADGEIHMLAEARAPIAARDADGRDLSAVLTAADGQAWESAVRLRDPAVRASLRDAVELTFPRPAAARHAWLILRAQNTPWAIELLHRFLDAQGAAVHVWYAATKLPAVGEAFERRLAREGFLHVYVATSNSWSEQGYLREVGPEAMKDQAVPLDLARVSGDTLRLRIEAPPSVWRIDAAELALEEPSASLPPAHDHTSSTLRSDDSASELPLLAARMGSRSVDEVLGKVDGRRLIMELGDTVELVFATPSPRAGLERTYLLRATGWYRIHGRGDGLPEFRTLARIATDRDGMARLAVEWANARVRDSHLARGPARAGGGHRR